MKAVVLSGSSDKGKTPSIRKVIDLLIEKGGKVIRTDELKKKYYNPDIRAVVVVSALNRKIIIGVCSLGDEVKTIEDNIKFAHDYSCDILITPTHAKDETTKVLPKHDEFKNNTTRITMPRTKPANESKLHAEKADEIIKAVFAIINKP